jgi:hypothetical protein
MSEPRTTGALLPCATISGPAPINLEGRGGCRYWVHHPFLFTGTAAIDDRLSSFPVVVFQPPWRDPQQTPLVIGLQGMAAPWQWNAFIVPTLLDMGIAVALFDTPLAGERSLVRNGAGDVVGEVTALLQHGARLQPALAPRIMDAVARDFATTLRLAEERHGLTDRRRALFGVSLGTLLAAFTFARDGLGSRLLGTIGHADLAALARSYAPPLTPLLAFSPVRAAARLVSILTARRSIHGAVGFLTVLRALCVGGEHCRQADPMAFLGRVGQGRQVRFLVGAADPVVRPLDAVACARRFPDGECYVVPDLEHGGGSFVEHVRTFLGTQLGDWRW